MENAQTGLPSWAAALAEQLHASFAAQMSRIRAEHEGVPRERFSFTDKKKKFNKIEGEKFS